MEFLLFVYILHIKPKMQECTQVFVEFHDDNTFFLWKQNCKKLQSFIMIIQTSKQE